MHYQSTAAAIPRLHGLTGQRGFTQTLTDLTLETWGSRQAALVGIMGDGDADEISRLGLRTPYARGHQFAGAAAVEEATTRRSQLYWSIRGEPPGARGLPALVPPSSFG